MEYTEDEQPHIDIDWFFIDKMGYIGHVASAGGQLPKSVASSKEDNEYLISFFGKQLNISEKILINPELRNILKLNSSQNEQIYLKDPKTFLRDFIRMGQKGLYSFDKTILGANLDDQYHLVITPEKMLNISSLPREVSNILLRTKIDLELSSVTSFKTKEVFKG